jgi:hypothetical protein
MRDLILFPVSAVQLVGGNNFSEGNVFDRNPETGIFGPVCDDSWNFAGVSL